MTKLHGYGLYGSIGGLLAGLLLSASVCAEDFLIENAWLRATAPGQTTAGVDLSVTSEQSAKLVGVTSAVSSAVELHSMTHENGMMKMREVEFINLPAGKRVDLRESGYHLMLIGLKTPLKAGDSVPLTLNIKVANQPVAQVKIRVEVRPLNAAR